MAALTADRNTTRETLSPQADYGPVKASTTIYKGAIVCTDSTGYCVPGADTAGLALKGIARAQADNASGAAGDIDVEVWADGVHHFKHSGLTQADVGKSVYALDDQTVALAAGVTQNVKIGTLKRVISTSKCAVDLNPHTGA
jgi:hypothetical protein